MKYTQMHVLVADILNALDKIPMLPPDFEPRLKVRRWLEVRAPRIPPPHTPPIRPVYMPHATSSNTEGDGWER